MISRLLELVSFALSQAFDAIEADWLDTRQDIADELEARGFEPEEIEIALDVAGRIRESLEFDPLPEEMLKSNRVYKFLEEWKLTPEARGYLLGLVTKGRITPQQRETIVERCLSIDSNEPIGEELIHNLTNWVISGDEDELGFYLTRTVH